MIIDPLLKTLSLHWKASGERTESRSTGTELLQDWVKVFR
jgi:hypothetical protein